jgi:hypothetical protein
MLMPVIVLIAVLYNGWILYSRWHSAVEARKQAAERERQRLSHEVEMNGGDRLKILDLYATSRVVHRGESTQLCYGVANAKSVAFDPPVKDVWPSRSRCVDVAPQKSTTYTLTADDGAGRKETGQVAVEVR